MHVAVERDAPVIEIVLTGGERLTRQARCVGGPGAGRGNGAALAMLTLSPAVRIYVATGATDLRRSIDGLSALVRARFDRDPFSGHLFLFRNRRGDRLKILLWDQSGFWVLYKHLEQGTFAWPGRFHQGTSYWIGLSNVMTI